MVLVADFETTTDKNDCRVWAYGLYEIDSKAFNYGLDIESFFRDMKSLSEIEPLRVYFHNLKFDGAFLLSYLLNNGFSYVDDKRKLESNTFTTLITDTKIFYSIQVCFERVGRNRQTVTFFDSLKILPFSVEMIAKGFDLPLKKLEIDYHKQRPVGYQLTAPEIDYLKNDVEIVGQALAILFAKGLTRMTAGSNALSDFKKTIGLKNFERLFPVIDYDADIRHSYRGGYTYANPKFKGCILPEGQVFDVNSLYPSVMYYNMLPYGDGLPFEGKYKRRKAYPLFVQFIRCQFTLKKNHLPTVQIKNNPRFMETEYLTDSGDVEIVLSLTNIDLKLLFDHYEVYNVEYLGGYMFKASNELFKDYIDKWTGVKIQAKIDGNKAMYQLSKLMLNSLYGKFATNPSVRNAYPVIENGIVKYKLHESKTKEPVYLPVGAFVTAYARNITIRSAQLNYDRFIYADTDSLHLIGLDEPKGLTVDPVELGAWSLDNTFKRAKYLRAKCYIQTISENGNEKIKVTVAGMPETIHELIDYSSFHLGMKFLPSSTGKIERDGDTMLIPYKNARLRPVSVRGGVVLVEQPFTINR